VRLLTVDGHAVDIKATVHISHRGFFLLFIFTALSGTTSDFRGV